jgi:hypothetical protein
VNRYFQEIIIWQSFRRGYQTDGYFDDRYGDLQTQGAKPDGAYSKSASNSTK